MNTLAKSEQIYMTALALVKHFQEKRLGRLVVLPSTFTPDVPPTIYGAVFAGTHQKKPLTPQALKRRTKETLHTLFNPNAQTSNQHRSHQDVLRKEIEAFDDLDQAADTDLPLRKVKRARVHVAKLAASNQIHEMTAAKHERQRIRNTAWPKGVKVQEFKGNGVGLSISTLFNLDNNAMYLRFQSGGQNAQNRYIADLLKREQSDMRFCIASINGKPQIVYDLSVLGLS